MACRLDRWMRVLLQGKPGLISLHLSVYYITLDVYASSPQFFIQLRLDLQAIIFSFFGSRSAKALPQSKTGYCPHIAALICVCLSKTEKRACNKCRSEALLQKEEALALKSNNRMT